MGDTRKIGELIGTNVSKFLELLESTTILRPRRDGTMLHARGVGFDKCFDELNFTNPAAVADIHREYIEAGQLIITNTLLLEPLQFGKHGTRR